MKILLTVVACKKIEDGNLEPLCEGIEIITPDDCESEKDFLTRAIKCAKGKYSAICKEKFLFADVQSLLNIIDKNSPDMICFDGGTAIRTAILKNAVKDCEDEFSLRMLGVFGCKNLLKSAYAPFSFEKQSGKFSDENVAGLLVCAETFGKVKAKLQKEIYSYAFNLLCERLVFYYAHAMLEIYDGDMTADKLFAFDAKLKAEIVLYLALEKRFAYAKLQKLRDKGFKISWLTARKFRKVLE